MCQVTLSVEKKMKQGEGDMNWMGVSIPEMLTFGDLNLREVSEPTPTSPISLEICSSGWKQGAQAGWS